MNLLKCGLIRESFEIRESLESHKFLEIYASLQPRLRFIELFLRFIQDHEFRFISIHSDSFMNL